MNNRWKMLFKDKKKLLLRNMPQNKQLIRRKNRDDYKKKLNWLNNKKEQMHLLKKNWMPKRLKKQLKKLKQTSLRLI